jgi:hypothetical protein
MEMMPKKGRASYRKISITMAKGFDSMAKATG